MGTVYETYRALPIEKGLLCLEPGDITTPYYCYPVNAEPIGFEGCILYCFLPEYGEMVFACNPENYGDRNVYPLAANFADFIRLVLACGSANPVEQIVGMNREQFDKHTAHVKASLTAEQKAAGDLLQQSLGLLPMDDPFAYVKSIQKDFDDSKIQFSDEYYDVKGIENPRGAFAPDQYLFGFEVTVTFPKKEDAD